MARRPRVELPDGLVHVTSRGNRREPIFADAVDYDLFLADLATTCRRFEWSCLAYALLPNHFHLVLDTPREALSEGMHWLNGRHARRFNWRHGFVGHLFQERFASTSIESDGHLLTSLRYVALNTWRAGLCADPLACDKTSHRLVAGAANPPRFLRVDRVLGLFGSDIKAARRRYVQFVEDGIAAKPAVPR